ncbi:MarR family winged helix-turn-helix transcriptional regulator [Cellulosimicrobium sp. CUA-896]|uniref:MarR family winged helix-turn-helix transcriptional regulator n=1 Tax=Cellulosimicrobium sp. CUA-896 TaxID=1517881 RepID=UPI00095BCEDF|nr:MarR family transcriptional regulator [Cellulosimicrobium sp. CUA-896]OLT55137.1 MarR family transcriptional regulator [Cellulosimicrobium sp. CUA-896]
MPESTQDVEVGAVSGDEPRWLSPSEKEAWTGAVSLMLLLPSRLDSAVQRAAGVTLFEYLTLSHMSEAPDRRLVMSELAYLTNGSLSRLSNVMKKFEARGWAYREPDPTDGRRTIAVLTDDGWAKVVEAAPAHVRSVREHVLDPLTATDQRALARIAAKLRTRPEDFAAS